MDKVFSRCLSKEFELYIAVSFNAIGIYTFTHCCCTVIEPFVCGTFTPKIHIQQQQQKKAVHSVYVYDLHKAAHMNAVYLFSFMLYIFGWQFTKFLSIKNLYTFFKQNK